MDEPVGLPRPPRARLPAQAVVPRALRAPHPLALLRRVRRQPHGDAGRHRHHQQTARDQQAGVVVPHTLFTGQYSFVWSGVGRSSQVLQCSYVALKI